MAIEIKLTDGRTLVTHDFRGGVRALISQTATDNLIQISDRESGEIYYVNGAHIVSLREIE